MKTFATFSLLLTLLSFGVAQPIIHRSHLLAPGDPFFVGSVSTVPDPGSSGANAVWDFSSVQAGNTALNTTVMASATPFAGDFPSANIALVDQTPGATFYQYILLDEGVWEEHGYVDPGFSNVTFGNPRTFLEFPVSYQGQWQDDFTYTIEYLVGDPVTTRGEGNVRVNVDGYGTLMLPQSTFDDVLRLRIIAEATDTTNFGGGLYERNYVYDTTIVWLSPSYHAPLATHIRSRTDRTTTVIIGDTLVVPETLEYSGFSFDPMAEPTSAILEAADIGLAELQISPNPFEQQLHIAFNAQKDSEVVMRVLDIHGREFHHEMMSVVEGKNVVDIMLPELQSGSYLMSFQTDKGVHVRKLIKI